MKLTFLQAKVPLTKGYEQKPDGTYIGGSYPGETFFTSHEKQINGTKELFDVLEKQAQLGHCLLTNSLTRPIVSESRKKLSDKDEQRQWILLDIDGIEGITGVEDFVQKCLPTQFHNVSYILQHSPSSGIKPGVRAHVFFLLYDAIDVGTVSSWLKFMNLDNQLLSDQITLSKNAMALTLTLDWIANNNGRIVYITPPECKNFNDPVANRIQLVEKKYDSLSFRFDSASSSIVRAKYRAKIKELRTAAGLSVSRKDDFYELRGEHEVVIDSLVEPARITDPIPDNDRFMRCNIDGGDSYAYYYFRDVPVYLHNFKGEPSVKLKLIDPEYYARVAKPDADKLKEKDNRPFIFRDETSDKWFMGIRKGNTIISQPNPVGSMQKIEHYFQEKGGTIPPDPIETWDRVFDPTSDDQYHSDKKEFNAWRQSDYMLDASPRSLIPNTIEKVLRHVTGDDKVTFDHFINWMAYVFQRRTKTGTAWVLHGCPGTGKGVLFHNIIRPIFGLDYCQTKQIRDLKDNFNGWMETSLFVNIDEANSEDAGRESKELVNALKQWITDPFMSVRHMQSTAVQKRSFINFIFTTNDFGVLPIQNGDRRFNVAPRQEQPIALDSNDLSIIKEELQQFAGYLHQYNVDAKTAHTPLDNQAKIDLKIAARSSVDEFVDALRKGNLQYFVDGVSDEQVTPNLAGHKAEFTTAVGFWLDDAKNDRPSTITHSEAAAAYVVLCRDKPVKIGTFKSMMAKRGCPSAKRRGPHGRYQGWTAEWKLTDEQKRDLKIHLSPVKTEADIEAEIRAEIASNSDEVPLL